MFVRVSVVARPTSVSVEVGKVSVPEFTMLEKFGVVRLGLMLSTLDPEPVVEVAPVPPLATGSVLDICAKSVVRKQYQIPPVNTNE